MKRNMVPLLGIAFVAAIVATGVVYGLFGGKLGGKAPDVAGQSIVVAARGLERGTVIKPEDLQLSQVKGGLKGSFSKKEEVVGSTLLEPLQKDEPVLDTRVASLNPRAGGVGDGIPAGMRAVSIRVTESSGLMGLLRGGSHVDLQAVADRNNSTELRTILQNVEVLRVNPQLEPTANSRLPLPIATMLVPAQYADLIALADAGARIRITLRNPLDDGTSPRHSLGLASVFSGASGSSGADSPGKKKERSAVAPVPDASGDAMELNVQVLGVSAAALSQLDSNLAREPENKSTRVAAFRPGADADALVRRLKQRQEVEVVSSSQLTASTGRPASVHASSALYRLHVQFAPSANSVGKLSLRVQPEISFIHGNGMETRRYEGDMPDGGSFLVKGLLNDQNDSKVWAKLFPGHGWNGRELVIFVTARSAGPTRQTVAQTSRGQ